MAAATQKDDAATASTPSYKVDSTCAQRMLKFINHAWTPFHAVGACLICAGDDRDGLKPALQFQSCRHGYGVACKFNEGAQQRSQLQGAPRKIAASAALLRLAEAMSMKLLAAGYTHVSEKDLWDIKPGGKYVDHNHLLIARCRLACHGVCRASAAYIPVDKVQLSSIDTRDDMQVLLHTQHVQHRGVCGGGQV